MSEPGMSDLENGIVEPVSVELDVSELAESLGLSEERPRNLQKNLKKLGLISLIFPAVAVVAFAGFSVWHRVQAIVGTLDIPISETSLEVFDPTLGSEVHAEHGRALLVVHEGYSQEEYPDRFENDQNYQNALRRLAVREEIYRNTGDVVIRVVQYQDFAKGKYEPEENVIYYVSMPDDGTMYSRVIHNGVNSPQSWNTLKDVLEEAGVSTIEVGGESRGLRGCASVAAEFFNQAGFNVEWCQDCIYPQIDLGEETNFPVAPVDILP